MIKNSRRKDLALKLYNYYTYYSKFEHIGLVTSKFFMRIHQNKEDEISTIKNSIKQMVLINENFKSFGDFGNEANKLITSISQELNLALEK